MKTTLAQRTKVSALRARSETKIARLAQARAAHPAVPAKRMVSRQGSHSTLNKLSKIHACTMLKINRHTRDLQNLTRH
jgi:hypothetical protein